MVPYPAMRDNKRSNQNTPATGGKAAMMVMMVMTEIPHLSVCGTIVECSDASY